MASALVRNFKSPWKGYLARGLMMGIDIGYTARLIGATSILASALSKG